MTFPPASVPPVTNDISPAPQPPRTNAYWVRLVVAWVLIFVGAAGVISLQMRSKEPPKEAAGNVPTAADINFRFLARYSVGAKMLLSSMPTAKSSLAKMQGQVDSKAVTQRNRLHAAIVAGELLDKNEALARLEKLQVTSRPAVTKEATDVGLLMRLYREGAGVLSAEERERLVGRHGWYGRLALAYGEPQGSAIREEATGPALRVFAGIWFFLALLGVVGVTGLVLFILATVRFFQGKLVGRFEPAAAQTARGAPCYLETFALYLGVFGISAFILRVLFPSWNWLGMVIYFALPAVLLWPLATGVTWGQLRQALGLHRGAGFWREVGAGIVGYIAGLPLLGAAFVVMLVLTMIVKPATPPTHPIIGQADGSFWILVWVFFLVAVWAPITEELFFRGALFGHMRLRWAFVPATIFISLLFAAIHPQGYLAIPVLATIAIVLSLLRQWRGSIIASITAHALNNTMAFILLVLFLR